MTEKLPPLEPPLPGQDDRLYLDSSAECSAGHWYSPQLVADYIAEAIMRLRAEQQGAWDALPADVKTNCAGTANPMLAAVSSLLVRLEHAESAANAADEELREVKATNSLVAPPDEGKLRSFLHTVLDHGCRYGDRHDPILTEQFCAKVTNEYLAELLALLGTPRPLVALTDEQLDVAVCDGGEAWRKAVELRTRDRASEGRCVGRKAIAAHCRLNGLTEPTP